MSEPWFVSRKVLDELHTESIRLFGGTMGVRDDCLIESALASAQNTYFYLSGDLYDIAATYVFHIAQAQAFLDGNKRTAIATALVFLAMNGAGYRVDDGRIYDAMIGITERRASKQDLAELLREVFQKA